MATYPIFGKVYEPMYDHSDKKYIKVTIPTSTRDYINGLHANCSGKLFNSSIHNPLEDDVLTLKVPFRYRRVMCEVEGDSPVSSLSKGDNVKIYAQFSGAWNVSNYSGFTWTIKKIVTPNLQ